MATTDITSGSTVYPSENQIETTQYEGSRAQEVNHTNYFKRVCGSHITSGFTSGFTHGDLDYPMAAGVAYISGHRIEYDGGDDITLAPSTTNYIYIQATFDGSGNIDVVQIVANTTGSVPSNAEAILQLVTGASSVTSGADIRNSDPYKPDSITGISLGIDHGNDSQHGHSA